MKTNIYTVWVGGTEVNDYLISKEKAIEIKKEWEQKGYDDVVIEKVLNINNEKND